MKRSFLATLSLVALFAMVMASSVSAQTTFLSENFDAVAGGVTPPAGWTKFISGTGGAEWRFDDVSAQAPSGGAFAGGQASISSDFAAGSGHDATLRSPDMDLSAAATVIMEWDHYSRMLAATTLTVSVFDGAVYNTVFVNAGGADNGSPTLPAHESFDVTALAGGASNANVEFNYVSGFDWWWYVDNVTVIEPAALDVSCGAITAPALNTGNCMIELGATETVSVDYSNVGGAALNIGDMVSIDVELDAVNVLSEVDTLVAALNPGATNSYSTGGTVDMSALGAHTLAVITSIAGDADTSNDTCLVAYNSPSASTVTYGWLENFDALPSNNGAFAMTVFDVPTDWINAQDDGASLAGNAAPNWGPNDFTTGSSGGAVGPQGDNTSGNGIYMYIEDSPSEVGDIELRSPCLDLAGGTGSPSLSFYNHSVQPAGLTNNILEVDIIDVTSGGVVTMSVASIAGNGASGWTNNMVDLTSFAPNLIRVQFRTNNDNGGFSDDIAIDDVALVDIVQATGMPPRPGQSVFDINNAVNSNLQNVASSANGPYFANVTQGGPLNMSWEGIAGRPLSCAIGALNVKSATYPNNIGQFDIGGPGTGGNGLPLNLGVLFDGIAYHANPVGLPIDAFFIVGPAGTGGLSLTMPLFGLAPGTILTTMQCVMSNVSMPNFYISNAIELTIQ
jgi:hypothetical protein